MNTMMNWSLRIFTAFRIPVRLHVSMLIIPVIVFGMDFGGVSTVTAMSVALALSVLLFGSVLAHEFGHALVGRRFGVHTEDIILTPIGGMARMRMLPERAVAEISIAIAGPLVSFTIAALSWIVLQFELPPPFAALTYVPVILFQMNLMLGLFNLVPALPMDGGRVFRGLLTLKFGFLKATAIAGRIGKSLALVAVFLSAWTLFMTDDKWVAIVNWHINPWTLLIIGMFIYSEAGRELRWAAMREAARNGAVPRGPFSHVQVEYTRNGQPISSSAPPDWETIPEVPAVSDGRVKVVEYGKVEVISRKDP